MNILIKTNTNTKLPLAKKYVEEDVNIITEIPLPSGTIEITANGEHDVTDYAIANVNVEADNLLVDFFNSSFINITKKDLQGATTIKRYSWYQDKNLISVDLPDTVTSLEMRAFSGCTNLETVNLPSSLTRLDTYVFADNINMKNITLPDSLKSIDNYSFAKCTSFEELIIPDSVTGAMGSFICQNCTNLKYIKYGNNVTHTGQGSLGNCTSLTDVVLGEGLTFINDTTFSGCTALTTITIPSKVQTISTKAFYNCTSLMEIICLATTPPKLSANSFENVPETCVIKVPANSVEAYKTSTNWSARADYIVAYEEE